MHHPVPVAALTLLLAGCHLVLPLRSPDRDAAPPELDAAGDLAGDAGARPDAVQPVLGCPPPAAVDSDTLALFAFDTLVDLTGKHTMTLSAGAGLEADPDCGGVARFPGKADSYGAIPAHSAWRLPEGSVDLWFRLEQPSATEEADLLSRDALGQALPGHLALIRAGDYLLARVQDDTNKKFHRCHRLTLDERWHHVGVNFGQPGLQMFVDGKEVPASGTAVDVPIYGKADCLTATSLGIDGNDNPWVVGASSRKAAAGTTTPITLPSRAVIDNLRISSRRRDFDSDAQCRDKYGLALGFVLCESTAAYCSFNAWIDGIDCNVLCAQLNGACLGAWDNSNEPDKECVVESLGSVPCDDKKETNICVCTQ